MSIETLYVRADDEKIEQLDQIAKHQSMTRDELINEAIDQFLDLHKWRIERIEAGIKAADEGRFVSEAEMDKMFGKREDA